MSKSNGLLTVSFDAKASNTNWKFVGSLGEGRFRLAVKSNS